MAKLKTDNQSPETAPENEAANTNAADGTTSAPAPDAQAQESSAQAPTPSKSQTKEPQEETAAEPDEFTADVLKAFSSYETLYVDRSGSVYIVGTPERIRGGAKLYKNPHFKKQ